MAKIRGSLVLMLILGETTVCTSLEPITLISCTNSTDCTFSNSSCSTLGVCQCIDGYVRTDSIVCTSVEKFKVIFLFENVTENSILVSWNAEYLPGVTVNYTINFNGTVSYNVTSPHLIKSLSDGEVHSVEITSNVIGRDGKNESVKSEMKVVRTVPLAPELFRNQSYVAPSTTIVWTPRNPDVDVYYVSLMGPGVSITNVTTNNSITFTGLGPGMNYTVIIVQQTNGPYARNSSKAIFEFRTQPTEPGPPKNVSIIDVGQRNISFSVTDPDNPNGDIVGYVFKLTYRIYPDTEYMQKTVKLSRISSGIYLLHNYILPGVTYMIKVFTENNGFNSTYNVTLPEVITLPDIASIANKLDPHQTNLTNTSGVIRWGRPRYPNGNMLAYRAVLNGGPDITQCRIYFLCIGLCNNTILGPPNDTCAMRNDTTLAENQKEMSLLVEDLRVGTTYTLSVVGYTEVGAGAIPLPVTLRTLSIVPVSVVHDSFTISYPSGGSSFNLIWTAPTPFPGEDLVYQVTLRDAIKYLALERVNETSPFYSPSYNVRGQLHNFYNYSIDVRPLTSAGPANIQTYYFTTPSRGVLGRPQRIQINTLSSDECKRILIQWSEANVEDRNGPITGYKIENKIGTEKWTYQIISPHYWAITNRGFWKYLDVREEASYILSFSAFGPYGNQTGKTYSSQKFITRPCYHNTAPEIVGIVFAFLGFLGVCLTVIFVCRRKVREIGKGTKISHLPVFSTTDYVSFKT